MYYNIIRSTILLFDIYKTMKWGVIVKKKEMTRVPVGDKLVTVTLLQIVPQDIVRYKTEEKDGYSAVVVWADKKIKKNKKGDVVIYKTEREFPISDEYVSANDTWKSLSFEDFSDIKKVSITWIAKGKGFQGVMKRCNAHWWPETHGSKFHRTIGSMGNRKPRRVMKGHPHAWHMGTQRITLNDVTIVDVLQLEDENLMLIKWSVPGSYNANLYVTIA